MKIHNTLLSGLLSLGLLSSAHADLNDGLVAYYPFNGNTNDESGNGNHGIPNGNIEYTPGIAGQGVRLHGVLSAGGIDNPDFIRVQNSPSLSFAGQQTIAYYVKIDGNQATSNSDRSIVDGIYGTILAKQGDRSGFYFTEAETSTSFGISQFDGGASTVFDSLATIQNRFRHVVYTINGNTFRIFVDGNLVSSGTGVVDFTSSNQQDLYIGVQNNARSTAPLEPVYWYPLDGTIDDLRLYNRMLSDAEVSQLFNAGSTNRINSDNLFNFAEQSFPDLFAPSGQPTQNINGFLARYYPTTDTWAGTNGDDVYVLGDVFGGLLLVGKIGEFIAVTE